MEEAMNQESTTSKAVRQKVLLHLYNSAVVGSLNSISLILRMKLVAQPVNSRYKDLQDTYDTLGPERRRLFYDAVASVAEFAVYRTLDFVVQYSRFDSESNTSEFPRVEVNYADFVDGQPCQVPISKFGTEELGNEWKEIARREDIRQLVEAAIKKVVGSFARKR